MIGVVSGKIRPYREEDFDDVYEIWLEGDLDKHWFIDTWEWRESKARVLAGLKESDIWVWEDKKTGCVLGFIALNGNDIRGFYVDMEHMHERIGGSLLRYAKEGREYLRVAEYERNKRHLRIYLHNYFERFDLIRDMRTNEEVFKMIWKRRHPKPRGE